MPRRGKAGVPVIFGDGLQECTLRRIPIEDVGTAIGATFNDNLNSQFVHLARHTFGVTRGLVAVDTLDGQRAPEHVLKHGADVLFDGAHDQEQWDVRFRHDEVEIARFRWMAGWAADGDAAGPANDTPQELFVMLALARGGRVLPMSMQLRHKPDDEVIVALFRREREAALSRLQARGWQPAPPPANGTTLDGLA